MKERSPRSRVTSDVDLRGQERDVGANTVETVIVMAAADPEAESLARWLGELVSDAQVAVIAVCRSGRWAAEARDTVQRATKLRVVHALSERPVQARQVYLVEPELTLDKRSGGPVLVRSSEIAAPRHVDALMFAAAEHFAERTIAVDASEAGQRAVEEAGGLVVLGREPGARLHVAERLLAAPQGSSEARSLDRICDLMQGCSGVDFSEYKRGTLLRCVMRRMQRADLDELGAYEALLQRTPSELTALSEAALVHTTAFFRDASLFDALRKTILPALLARRGGAAPLRLWVAGCASGEEAYSLAITLLEVLPPELTFVLFASDVSERMVHIARRGVYPENALRDLKPGLRERYFRRVEGGLQVTAAVRERCIFARHDLARDPPYAKLDLVSCRNVLIYFEGRAQERILSTLHYALHEDGCLVLGKTEDARRSNGKFSAAHAELNVFQRVSVAPLLQVAARIAQRRVEADVLPSSAVERALSQRLDQILLDRYAPPCVVLDEHMRVVQTRGPTRPYLSSAGGVESLHKQLASGLRTALAQVRRSGAPRKVHDLEVPVQVGTSNRCAAFLAPIDVAGKRMVVVRFEAHGAVETEPVAGAWEVLREGMRENDTADRDLRYAYDALTAVHEELLCNNEELQSVNEELQTAQEQLLSTNQALQRTNAELDARNHDLERLNCDLINVLTTVGIPILMLDERLRVRRFTPNARQIAGLVASDVGRALGDLQLNFELPHFEQHVGAAIDEGESYEDEVQTRDGTWHRLQIRPYVTSDGRVDGAVIALIDIDALKHVVGAAQRANREAEQANRLKDDFMATLSHELRSPLHGMLAYAQLLQRSEQDPGRARRASDAIESGVLLLVRLIDDMLDVSRIMNGKIQLYACPLDLAAVVRRVLDDNVDKVTQGGLELRAKLAERARVLGDAARLQQVVANLISNAIKFTPRGGSISVELTVADGRATLCVSDTGAGIEAGFLPRVFERFTQANTSLAREFGGLGLGLAIARHLVLLHEGEISASSAGLHKGARFCVSLPLHLEASALPALDAAPAAPADPRTLDGMRVLVVDDDHTARHAIGELLTLAGAEVWSAPSAADAMEALGDFVPDVMLCDIAMPRDDGLTLIQRVRAQEDPALAHIPAVAMTALARSEDQERTLAAGYQKHLAKPVDIDILTRTLVELSPRR